MKINFNILVKAIWETVKWPLLGASVVLITVACILTLVELYLHW